MKKAIILTFIVSIVGCDFNSKDNKVIRSCAELSGMGLKNILSEIVPHDKIVHKGILNPELTEYYYTLSDKQYNLFDVFVIKKDQQGWSKPQKAFFNSDYSDHGMSFSPNGKSIYFSSTRPTGIKDVSQTWHIWTSNKINEQWTEPEFVDIPNLRDKLNSHPIITEKDKLFFHSSNLDYSEMDIYESIKVDGIFSAAKKSSINVGNSNIQKCTPYVSHNETYMLFASIGKQLDLMISYNDGNGNWENTRKLRDEINFNGQGNPWVTPDNQLLFYTTGNPDGTNWKINFIDIGSELKNN